MNNEEARKLAEAHWGYNQIGLKKALMLNENYSEEEIDDILDLIGYYYIEAMVHGVKHEREEPHNL